MQAHAEALIKKNLQKSDAEVVFASLFGSYRRGDYDAFSDIDVFVVCMEEDEKPLISHRLKRLETTLNRSIHVNVFNLKEFESRLRFHDYLTASIIEDSSFILGRKDIFAEAKRSILEGRPDEDSVRFNRDMGLKTLEHAYSCFSEIDPSGPYDSRNSLDYIVRGLNNYRLGLGYIYASAEMQFSRMAVSPVRLLRTDLGSTLKDIARIEKIVKRGLKIDHVALSRIIDEIRSSHFRILTLNQVSPMELSSLLKFSAAASLSGRP